MKQFEYRTVNIKFDAPSESPAELELDKKLNVYGCEGWEVIKIKGGEAWTEMGTGNFCFEPLKVHYIYTVTFKREKE